MVFILAAKIPDAPLSLANNIAITTSGVIGLTWSPGAYNGGSPVIDYQISYFTGTNSYTILASGVSTATYTVTSLTADTIYTFKIEARNLVGLSAFSSEVSIRASAIPDNPIAPTSTMISNTFVVITWTPPNNRGSSITSYTISILQSVGTTFS